MNAIIKEAARHRSKVQPLPPVGFPCFTNLRTAPWAPRRDLCWNKSQRRRGRHTTQAKTGGHFHPESQTNRVQVSFLAAALIIYRIYSAFSEA